MILETLAIYALLQCTTVVARLIGRRRDVFHYVSRSNPSYMPGGAVSDVDRV
jgi:hypothetical protein